MQGFNLNNHQKNLKHVEFMNYNHVSYALLKIASSNGFS